jgi:hypothetical protein
MNKTTKTVAVITIATAFVYVQGHELGQLDHLAPSTISAMATSANTSNAVVTVVCNAVTDDPIDIVAPVQDRQNQG